MEGWVNDQVVVVLLTVSLLYCLYDGDVFVVEKKKNNRKIIALVDDAENFADYYEL
jgi:hypothetical protein